MFNKLNLIPLIALGVVVAHDIKIQIEAKKLTELFITAHQVIEETEQANQAKIQYLCHLLDEHGVPADEFDLIALNFHSQ